MFTLPETPGFHHGISWCLFFESFSADGLTTSTGTQLKELAEAGLRLAQPSKTEKLLGSSGHAVDGGCGVWDAGRCSAVESRGA